MNTLATLQSIQETPVPEDFVPGEGQAIPEGARYLGEMPASIRPLYARICAMDTAIEAAEETQTSCEGDEAALEKSIAETNSEVALFLMLLVVFLYDMADALEGMEMNDDFAIDANWGIWAYEEEDDDSSCPCALGSFLAARKGHAA